MNTIAQETAETATAAPRTEAGDIIRSYLVDSQGNKTGRKEDAVGCIIRHPDSGDLLHSWFPTLGELITSAIETNAEGVESFVTENLCAGHRIIMSSLYGWKQVTDDK